MSIFAYHLGEMDEPGAGGIMRSVPEEPIGYVPDVPQTAATGSVPDDPMGGASIPEEPSVGYVPDEPTGVQPKERYVPDDPTT